MPRIPIVERDTATHAQRELFHIVQDKLGRVPNLLKTLAHSPATTRGYLQFACALTEEGVLSAELREQIALAVSEANGCDYCLAAHHAVGTEAGLDRRAIANARHGTPEDPKSAAAVQFARDLVDRRGWVGNEGIEGLRTCGFDDGSIVEIIAVTALTTFTNYFTHVAAPRLDFPPVPDN